MDINNISGLPSSRANIGKAKTREKTYKTIKTDRVQISDKAREKQFVNNLRTIVKEYLDKLPSIRKDKVESVNRKMREGYRLDDKKLSVIAERIMNQFKI